MSLRKQTAGHRSIRRCLYLILACFLLMGSFPANAAEKMERETVKAGFFAWDGYHVEDETGLRSGYGYDLLRMTESYCNWKIEFVGYDKTWADMLTMLDNGEIDLLTSAQKTPEWEEKYDYSEQSVGSSATVLSVRSDEKQFIVGDASTYNGMIVGCLAGSSRNDRFLKYAEEQGIQFRYVYYHSLSELKQALADQEVDGILSTNLRTFNGETVLEEFDTTDYYVIVKKGNSKVLNQINHAIDEMNFNSPSWKEELQNEYFASRSEDDMVFHAEELAYLEQLKEDGTVFTVVTNPDLAPYSYYDEQGKPAGIAPTLFCEIADRIGLQYKFEKFQTYEEYNLFVRQGKADIDLTCFHDYGLGAQHGIDITNPYMTTSLAIVTRTSATNPIRKIAEVEGSSYNTTYAAGLFADCEKVTFQSNAEIIQAVEQGTADAAYQYTYAAQKSVESDYRNKLSYSVLPQYEIKLCMGTNDKLDYRLLAVLNEGIRALSGTYTENIIQENITSVAENSSFLKLIYEYPLYAMLMVVILMTALIFLLFVFRMKKLADQKLLNEAANSKARTEFFMMISHEIRTPLNAVVSYLRMLKEEYSMEEGASSYLEKAQLAALQLTEISDNMQDYSNISLGTITLGDEIIKIKNVILQLDQIISIKAKAKKQDYNFEVCNLSRQYLAGDNLRVTLIFQNILENAVKFTPEGGTVSARLEEQCIDQEHVNLIFTCKDNGKGMSEAFTEKINTAFHQSDSSYSRTHGGLGLGLFLTQFYIKMMHGSFQLESKEGEGSLITITLPMISPSIDVLREKGIRCRAIRAMVYENDEYNIKMAKETLKSVGVKVDIAGDMDSMTRKILSREGGPYAYALCIINVDLLTDYMDSVHSLLKQTPSVELVAITGDETRIPELESHREISHVVSMQNSYFQLFNAVITDFGEADEKEDAGEKYDYSGVHALIAEDNPVNADILSKMLEKKNMKATICQNGKIAVETFEKEAEGTYQIIFMDIQMPEMDGLEAAKRIRNSTRKTGATVPIVAVSANAFPEDVRKSIEAGMNEHIAKPVDRNLLYGEIQKYCGKNIIDMQKEKKQGIVSA